MAEQPNEKQAGPDFMSEETKQKRKQHKKKVQQMRKFTENIFKVLSVIVVLGSVICIPDFIHFREYCQAKGIYIVPPTSLIWAVVGFTFHWFARKWWSLLMQKRFKNYMHPRNQYAPLDEQQKKIRTITKQAYDLIFHTITTIAIIVLFHKQNWYPMCMGGYGSCNKIFSEYYPRWPQHLNPELQIFYLFQLGTNIYQIIDLVFLRRQYYKSSGSYYQLVFHHCVATILTLFSFGYNLITVGTMVMLVHDSSDATRALSRVVTESKYAIQRYKLSKFLDTVYFVVWGYMRILILPLCLIESMYNKILEVDSIGDITSLYLHRYYLISLVFGIYFLHSYWIYFLVRGNVEQWTINEQFIKWQEWQAAEAAKESSKTKQKPIKQE